MFWTSKYERPAQPLRLWDAVTGICQFTRWGAAGSLAFSSDGAQVITDFGVFSGTSKGGGGSRLVKVSMNSEN